MAIANLAPMPPPRVAPDAAARRWVGDHGCAWTLRPGPGGDSDPWSTVATWSGTVDELAQLAEDTAEWREKVASQTLSSRQPREDQFNSHEWSEWLDIARSGYPEGAARVRETAAHLRRHLRGAEVAGSARRVRRTVSGGRPVVADWLSGRPDCYRRRRRARAANGRVVRVGIIAGANWKVTDEALSAYVVGSLAVVQTLRALGLEAGLDAIYAASTATSASPWFPTRSVATVSIVRPGSVETDTRTAVAACVDTLRRGIFSIKESCPTGVTEPFGLGYGRSVRMGEIPNQILAGWDLVLPPIEDYNPGQANEWADPEKAAAYTGEKMPEHLKALGVSVR